MWLLLLAVSQALASDPASEYLECFERASKAERAGRAEPQGELLDSARREFAAALELRPRSPICAYRLACVEALAGRPEPALAWLDRAIEFGWVDAAVALWDEELASLRGDARFEEAIDRMRRAREAAAEGQQDSIRLYWGGPSEPVRGLAGGQHVVCGSDRACVCCDSDRACVWDLARDEPLELPPFPLHTRSVHASPADPGVLASVDAGRNGRLHVLSGGPGFRVPRAVGGTQPALFSLDGSRVAIPGKDVGEIRDVASGVVVARFEDDGTPVVLSPDGRFYLRAPWVDRRRRRVSFYAVDGSSPPRDLPELLYHEIDLGFDPSGAHAFVLDGVRGDLLWLDGRTGEYLGRLEVEGTWIEPPRFIEWTRFEHASFATDRCLVVTDDQGRLHLAEPRARHPSQVLELGFRAESLRVTPNGRFACLTGPSSAWRVIELSPTPRTLDTLHAPPRGEFDVLGDEELIWSGGGVWRVVSLSQPANSRVVGPDWLQVEALSTGRAGPEVLARDKAGNVLGIDLTSARVTRRVASGRPYPADWHVGPEGGDAVLVWSDGSTWNSRVQAFGSPPPVPEPATAQRRWFVRLSPDGAQWFVWALDTPLYMVQPTQGAEPRAAFVQPGVQVTAVQWLPDNRRFVVGTDLGDLLLFELGDPAPRARARAHQPIASLALIPNGSGVAAGGADGELYLWDFETDRVQLASHDSHVHMLLPSAERMFSYWVNDLSFSPDESRLFTYPWSSGYVAAWDSSRHSSMWVYNLESSGGLKHIAIDSAGRLVCVLGRCSWVGPVLGAQDGRIRGEFPRDAWGGGFSRDGRWLAGMRQGGLVVFDAQTFSHRYDLVGFPEGELVSLPSQVVRGSSLALARTWASFEGQLLPIANWASHVADERRVEAALAGIEVALQRWPDPPSARFTPDAAPREGLREFAGELELRLPRGCSRVEVWLGDHRWSLLESLLFRLTSSPSGEKPPLGTFKARIQFALPSDEPSTTVSICFTGGDGVVGPWLRIDVGR